MQDAITQRRGGNRFSGENSMSTTQKSGGVRTALGVTTEEGTVQGTGGEEGRLAEAGGESFALAICQALLTAPGKQK